MAIEITSGAVVYRKNNGEIEYLLLESQNKGHFWGFPKGHVEGNETLEETAKREINEETQLVLPIDNKVAPEFSNDAPITVVSSDSIPADQEGLDIGPATVKLFSDYLQDAKTVVWNGPMGVFEFSNFAGGTIGVCEAIAHLEGATTIIGGGDSAAAAAQLGYADKFTHISTGGGASLEYLEGKELPGVASISDK